MERYQDVSVLCKALSDPTRLQIIDILSCGRLCACKILEGLQISQSTLSHHMKVLSESNLVTAEKEATWMFYSLNEETISKLQDNIKILTTPKEECFCNRNCESSNK